MRNSKTSYTVKDSKVVDYHQDAIRISWHVDSTSNTEDNTTGVFRKTNFLGKAKKADKGIVIEVWQVMTTIGSRVISPMLLDTVVQLRRRPPSEDTGSSRGIAAIGIMEDQIGTSYDPVGAGRFRHDVDDDQLVFQDRLRAQQGWTAAGLVGVEESAFLSQGIFQSKSVIQLKYPALFVMPISLRAFTSVIPLDIVGGVTGEVEMEVSIWYSTREVVGEAYRRLLDQHTRISSGREAPING